MNKPITVGVTGGIGSGKTIVCRLFSTFGIPIYYADLRAKVLSDTDSTIIDAIKAEFGSEAYSQGGQLNRKFIAKIAFYNPHKLERLNGIIHPVVEADFRKWITTQPASPYFIKEAALLLESGSYKNLDYIITVFAAEKQKIAWTLARDKHRSIADIMNIMARQSDDQAKFEISQFRIDNSGESLLIPQVLKIHEFLVNMAQTG